MLDKIIALFALLVLAGFIGVLVFKLQRMDLFVVAGITLLLAGWDFLSKEHK
jgi:D-serine deaminase-like pyridoxal phosphate-dependent protein